MRKLRNPRIPIPRSESSYSSHVMTPSLRARPLEQTIVTVSLGIFQVRRIEIVRSGGRKPALHPVHNVVWRVVVEGRTRINPAVAPAAVFKPNPIFARVRILVDRLIRVDAGASAGEALVDLGGEGVLFGAGGLDFQGHRRSSTL